MGIQPMPCFDVDFDVVVVGAGPAGGHCARKLAQKGYRVLLMERYKDFETNSFSSSGTPNETLSRYDLPDSIVGSYWNEISIVTSNQTGTWRSSSIQGTVLDFAKLRSFLAEETRIHQGEVWLNCLYVRHEVLENQTLRVHIRREKQDVTIETRLLIDATGPNRSVMYANVKEQPELITGTGVEFLIKVDAAAYARSAKALTFFLGYKWMPKGYSWIFPMTDGQLKVGAGIVNLDHEYVKEMQPLKHYIQLIIDEYIKPESYEILERHGGTVRYSLGLKDKYVEGNTIAIGDAVSTINFLGGEGIRHAMQSAEIAVNYIDRYLQGNVNAFEGYQAEMHRVFLKDWTISEKLGLKKYLADSDRLVDRVVNYLRPLKLEDVVDILFYYKFEKASKGLGSYIWRNFKSFWAKVFRKFFGKTPGKILRNVR
jgi:digeranylgeranylglycerophospholipid reductase